MTNEELEVYLRGLGWQIELLVGNDGMSYIVVRDYPIASGSLAGRVCDVAIQRTPAVPYIMPPVIHTRPALVAMDMVTFHTQASSIGPEWQYWSRALQGQATPHRIVTHIATTFAEVKE